jgi:hypothetical protein
MRARRFLPLLFALGCDVPDDGTLQVAFLLQTPPPAETRLIPPELQTGVPAAAFGQARGRCECDVRARSARCTFEGLPAVSAATGQPLVYRLRFLLWYAPLPPRFDATTLDRDPGGRDPDAPPPPMAPPLPRAVVGPVSPDPFGQAERSLTSTDIPLERVAGGELQLMTTGPAGDTAIVVIDGRVGNLPAAATEPAAPSAPRPGGGHVH